MKKNRENANRTVRWRVRKRKKEICVCALSNIRSPLIVMLSRMLFINWLVTMKCLPCKISHICSSIMALISLLDHDNERAKKAGEKEKKCVSESMLGIINQKVAAKSGFCVSIFCQTYTCPMDTHTHNELIRKKATNNLPSSSSIMNERNSEFIWFVSVYRISFRTIKGTVRPFGCEWIGCEWFFFYSRFFRVCLKTIPPVIVWSFDEYSCGKVSACGRMKCGLN